MKHNTKTQDFEAGALTNFEMFPAINPHSSNYYECKAFRKQREIDLQR